MSAVIMCTHGGLPEHPWEPGESCPVSISAGTWAVRDAAPAPSEVVAAGERVETVARGIASACWGRDVDLADESDQWADLFRSLAAAAIAADPSPAEEADLNKSRASVEMLTAPVRVLRAERDEAREAVKRVEVLIDPATEMGYSMWGDRLFSERNIPAALASPAPAPQDGAR